MNHPHQLMRHDLLINGEAVPPSGGKYSTDLDPATEEPIALVAEGTVEDVERFVEKPQRVRDGRGGRPVFQSLVDGQ